MSKVSERLLNAETPNTLVHHFLEKSAAVYPEKIAVVHETNRYKYSQVNDFSNQLAHFLIKAGVGCGDRVVLLCENSCEYIFCYYGILKTGAIAAPLNTELKPAGMVELLNELQPGVLILSSKFEQSIHSLDASLFSVRQLIIINPQLSWSSSGFKVSSLNEALSGQPEHNLEKTINPRSCAMIIYTSGSVGKPKGVMLSHTNIVVNARAIIEYLELNSADIQMVVLPFFYVMGKSLLNTHFAVGGSVVLHNKFAYTASVLEWMSKECVTGFSGVPSTYALLLFKSPLAKYRERLPNLRYCSQAGGHMPKHIKLEFLKILPQHTRLIIMYGATEAAARLTYVPPDFLLSKIDSIGKPIPGVSITIRSPAGMALKSGEIGEIVVRGDNIMLGYYRDEKSTKKAIDRHGYHTGDYGYFDNEGFLFLTGRKDNQIKVGGHRFNPQAIEDIIIESGYARECIVLGIPNSRSDVRLTGLVVPVGQVAESTRQILKYCALHLPKYKVPESLWFVAEIPKNSNGKPDRDQIMELYQGKSGDHMQGR